MPGSKLSATRAPGLKGVQNMFDSSLCTMQYRLGSANRDWGVGSFEGVLLDGISVYRDEAIGFRHVTRERHHIDESPSDAFLLAMPFSAQISHRQHGQSGHCGPGSALLFPVSRPFSSSIRAESPDGHYLQCLTRVSGTLLRQKVPQIDSLGSVIFSVDAGAGRILKSLLLLAMEEADALSELQSRHLSQMLVDAIGSVVCECAANDTLPAAQGTSLERTYRKAVAYIDSNLSDAGLDVAQIAQQCRVSARYLHAAFAAAGMKVGAYLREARLQACRSALRNPALVQTSVTDIAMRWGFNDSAHFSRAYKARFGCPPSQDRC